MTVDLFGLAFLIAGPPLAGWLVGLIIDAALVLRDLRAGREVYR